MIFFYIPIVFVFLGDTEASTPFRRYANKRLLSISLFLIFLKNRKPPLTTSTAKKRKKIKGSFHRDRRQKLERKEEAKVEKVLLPLFLGIVIWR